MLVEGGRLCSGHMQSVSGLKRLGLYSSSLSTLNVSIVGLNYYNYLHTVLK